MRSMWIAGLVGLSLAVSATTAAASADVGRMVAKKAAILSNLHKKARKALVNAAQDKSYTDLLANGAPADHHDLKSKVDEVSLAVQARFHVEEMCLIGADGKELSRIVLNSIANDLSEDETGANFFQPGFALEPRQAFISPIYMSPDADKLVVAYVTPVRVGDENKAILHYEQGLDMYQEALNKDLGGDKTFLLAVNEDGLVVSDSRGPIPVAKSGDEEDVAAYVKPFRFGDRGLDAVLKIAKSGEAISDSGGNAYKVASKKVGRWTLLGFDKQ